MRVIFDALGFGRVDKGSRSFLRRSAVPILLYHHFTEANPATPWTVTARAFEDMLVWLTRHGCSAVPLRHVVDDLSDARTTLPGREFAITADDGARSVYTHMYPIIRKYRVPVTLFVCTSTVSSRPNTVTWDQLGEMSESGLVDIQSHTVTHPNFHSARVHLTDHEYRQLVEFELDVSKQTLKRQLGVSSDLFAWPYGIFDEELEQAAAEQGYRAAFATKKKRNARESRYSIPRISIHNRDRGSTRFPRWLIPEMRLASLEATS